MSKQIVEQVKADLIAAGVIPADASKETDNRVPFLITAETARRTGGKLFLKNAAQNGYTFQGVRYGHDGIAYADSWVDCLKDAGPPANGNVPVWQVTTTKPTGQLADPPPFIINEPNPGTNAPNPGTPAPPPLPDETKALLLGLHAKLDLLLAKPAPVYRGESGKIPILGVVTVTLKPQP